MKKCLLVQPDMRCAQVGLLHGGHRVALTHNKF